MSSPEGPQRAAESVPSAPPTTERDEFRWQLSLRVVPAQEQTEWLTSLETALNEPAYSTRQRAHQRRRAIRSLRQTLVAASYPKRTFDDVPTKSLPVSAGDARLALEAQLRQHVGGRVDRLLNEYLAAFEATGGEAEYQKEYGRVWGSYASLESRSRTAATIDEFLALRREIDDFLTDVAHRYRVLLGWEQHQRRVERGE